MTLPPAAVAGADEGSALPVRFSDCTRHLCVARTFIRAPVFIVLEYIVYRYVYLDPRREYCAIDSSSTRTYCRDLEYSLYIRQ